MLLSDVCVSVWCLFVTYIGPKWRTERHRKTKIGTEVAYVARDSDTTFKVKGQGRQAGLLTTVFTHRQLQRSVWERIKREKLLLRCRLQALGRPWDRRGGHSAHGAGDGRGISCCHAHSLVTSRLDRLGCYKVLDTVDSNWRLIWQSEWWCSVSVALCGLRGCKNSPDPFPGQMSYKTSKPGSVCPVS